MGDWMTGLADHYADCRRAHPADDLLIVFDIDGTILDMRHMMCHVLTGFDRERGTDLFAGLRAEDIDVHENQVERFLERRGLPSTQRDDVVDWYLAQRWAPASVLAAHRPYRGVLEVIRWFQIQPSTSVALNTGRPERLRDETLRCLNALGREYRVTFEGALLHMNPDDWEIDVAAHKVEGLDRFRDDGYRIVAVVDNEPQIIEDMASADQSEEILFLHADTLYESRRAPTPRTIGGTSYDLCSLVAERDLPGHVQLVWHGVNDQANLRQFLASPVRWGEIDVRRDRRDRLVLRHDSFDMLPPAPGERPLPLAGTLSEMLAAGKGVKLDLKDGGALADVLALLVRHGVGDADLWFNGRLDVLGEEGVQAVAAAHPAATLQCPIDFLAPLVAAMPDEARRLMATMAGWGVNRFSVGWGQPQTPELLDRLDEWGYDVNLYAVSDLEQFLRAALLLPRSITADFNFPEWHYYGRGAGRNGHYHRYRLDGVATPVTDGPQADGATDRGGASHPQRVAT
jgi:hypothetical protein